MQRNPWIILLLGLITIPVLACGGNSASAMSKKEPPPAKVEKIEGTSLSRVIVTEKGAARLGLELTPVRDAQVARRGISGTEMRRVVPFAAVLYDPKGDTWAYTSPAPLTFVRQRIVVDYVVGGLAVLSDGPPLGTGVVTVAAVELFGAETGIK